MAEIILLTILCICEIVQLVFLALVYGYYCGRKPKSVAAFRNDVSGTSDPAIRKETTEALEAQRKKFDEEMKAFQEMLNYNADVAYGMKNNEE